MKVLVLYRPNSEYSRLTEEFIHGYRTHHPEAPVELLDIDSLEGGAAAELYDVTQYPAILALQSSGNIQKVWQGPALPRFEDVAAYVHG